MTKTKLKLSASPEEAKHTPGPWKALGIDDKPHDYYPVQTHDMNGSLRSIASVITECHAIVPCKEGNANARLIAAAPELLEAAKYALIDAKEAGHSDDVPGIAVRCPNCSVCKLEVAIAKAEGR